MLCDSSHENLSNSQNLDGDIGSNFSNYRNCQFKLLEQNGNHPRFMETLDVVEKKILHAKNERETHYSCRQPKNLVLLWRRTKWFKSSRSIYCVSRPSLYQTIFKTSLNAGCPKSSRRIIPRLEYNIKYKTYFSQHHLLRQCLQAFNKLCSHWLFSGLE